LRLFRQPAPGDWHGAVAQAMCAWQERSSAARDYEHGNALAGARRYADAAAAYLAALQRDPHCAGAWNNLGNVLHALGRQAESVRAYRQAIALAPDYAVAHNNLGVGLKSQARLAEAESSLREAIRIHPGYPEAWNNLGNVLRLQDRNAEAVAALTEAVRLNPSNADAWTNLGVAQQADNRLPEALAALTRATELAPAMAEAQWNLAIAQLLSGDLRRGFAGYESGFRTGARPARSLPMPRWAGEPLAGKRLLVWAEQGFGDSFQFVRFLPLLKARGATVILECQKGLKGVLAGCPGADAVVEAADSPAHYASCDFHVPLMSLPALLGTTPGTIPPPGLAPDPARVDAWRARLPATGRRVGIVWAGRPQHQNDRNRSCPLAAFAPLAAVPGVTLVSLQKGEGAEQLARFAHRERVLDLGATLVDFADTAAVISNLDLVITVDTSVAHLAGALGRPVWVLLPFAPDWRWLLARDDSPWYPSARLFRQSAPGDWDGVLARAARALGGDAGPDASEAHAQGNRAVAAGRGEAAEAAWQEAIRLAPGWVPPLFNLAVRYRQTHRQAEGHALLEQAARMSPNDANVLSALAVSCEEQGDASRARELLDRAVAAEPGHAGAHVNRALIRLGQGDYAGGFAEYAWREAIRPPPAGLAAIPRWDGSRFDGRTLLVYAEQGYGDLFQFARFLPLARARGGRVVFHTLAGTREVIQGVGVDAVTEEANGEKIDWQIPLLSLPAVLGIGADNLPVAAPYLAADPGRVQRWRPVLAGTGLRVGVAWAGREQWPGNPHRERACPPELLFALAGLPGVRLFSLQKETDANVPPSIIDLGRDFRDFADTAAALMSLDLVISIDTGVAHLAGALGRPLWVLLPSTPDWRWTTPSPGGWYPGSRVFLPPRPGDWASVLAAVSAELVKIPSKQQVV
jgi:tetratricopeptide (TPR) repeat protein